jgi:hypothetical protein
MLRETEAVTADIHNPGTRWRRFTPLGALTFGKTFLYSLNRRLGRSWSLYGHESKKKYTYFRPRQESNPSHPARNLVTYYQLTCPVAVI